MVNCDALQKLARLGDTVSLKNLLKLLKKYPCISLRLSSSGQEIEIIHGKCSPASGEKQASRGTDQFGNREWAIGKRNGKRAKA
jgi:hypothetical protein